MKSLFDYTGTGPGPEPINVVLFAGGGGADVGIEAAGFPVHVAINHDPEAIAMHRANFPDCEHHTQDVWAVSPLWATRGRKVNILWASPDCKHFSKAKGGKPRDQKIRDLAWVVEKWAREVRPAFIFLENVEEFRDWGPLDAQGQPVESAKGETFRAWRNSLRKLGYRCEFRELRACDYGTPTIRKRLFMVARRDGGRISWPSATHGAMDSPGVRAGRLQPFHTAAECIQWEIPCPSVFERKKALADNTLRRVAAGIRKFVQDCERPFLVQYNGRSESHPITEPCNTVTSRDSLGLVAPHISTYYGQKREGEARGCSMGDALPTQTTENRHALVAPALMTNTTGHAPGGVDEPIATLATGNHQYLCSAYMLGAGGPSYSGKPVPADEPMRTLLAKNHRAVAMPFIVKGNHTAGYYHCFRGQGMQEPLQTITRMPGFSVCAPCLVPRYGERQGQAPRCRSVSEPMATVVPTGNGGDLCGACLVGVGGRAGQSRPRGLGEPTATTTSKADVGLGATCLLKNYSGVVGQPTNAPLGTVTGKDHHSHVAATIIKERGTNTASDINDPLHTVSAQGTHHALTLAHAIKYYETNTGFPLDGPAHTVTSKHRHGLVESKTMGGHAEEVRALLAWARRKEWKVGQADEWAEILADGFEGQAVIDGEVYTIADIGLRMLQPRELARAQGFKDSFVLAPEYNGKPLSKTAQVRMIGNSVPPQFPEALVKANVEIIEAAQVADA